MATHMNENGRIRIEFLLSLNWPASEIARDRGRPESTILREIHGRRIRSDRNYGCSNRICAHYDTCTRIMSYDPNPKRSFRYSQKCYLVCPEFREAVCTKLANAPYVCNGCEKFHNCPLMLFPCRKEKARQNLRLVPLICIYFCTQRHRLNLMADSCTSPSGMSPGCRAGERGLRR